MRLTVADPSLVLLVGPSGSGKSTFARRHFPASAILSSDELRAVLADDPNDQGASAEAFQVLALLLGGRLSRRLLTVLDATNLRASSRRRWLRMAERVGLPAVAICFDFPIETYLELNRQRPGRQVEDEVVRGQGERMRTAMAEIPREGYDAVYLLRDRRDITMAEVELIPAGLSSPRDAFRRRG